MRAMLPHALGDAIEVPFISIESVGGGSLEGRSVMWTTAAAGATVGWWRTLQCPLRDRGDGGARCGDADTQVAVRTVCA